MNHSAPILELNRRQFLKVAASSGGGLMLAFNLPGCAQIPAGGRKTPAPQCLAGSDSRRTSNPDSRPGRNGSGYHDRHGNASGRRTGCGSRTDSGGFRAGGRRL